MRVSEYITGRSREQLKEEIEGEFANIQRKISIIRSSIGCGKSLLQYFRNNMHPMFYDQHRSSQLDMLELMNKNKVSFSDILSRITVLNSVVENCKKIYISPISLPIVTFFADSTMELLNQEYKIRKALEGFVFSSYENTESPVSDPSGFLNY